MTTTNVDHDVDDVPAEAKALGARLASERQRLGLSQPQLGESCGVSKTSQVNYESGKRSPDTAYLSAAMRIGVDVLFVISGNRQPTAAGTDQFITIPLLQDIRASAGYGQVNEPSAEYTVQGLAFSVAWLNQRKLNPQQLKVIVIKGRSMEPVLSDDDRVLIDMSDRQPRSGFVYVLRQADELLVKYCQLLPGGTLRVSSANPQYAPYDITLHDAADVEILGRVVASMHEW
jgi:phage repressor protein C with HTH and peptisase S24 domain